MKVTKKKKLARSIVVKRCKLFFSIEYSTVGGEIRHERAENAKIATLAGEEDRAW